MIINRKFGDYVLLRRLAVGGQSEVFLALKVGPGEFMRPVVIKALPPQMRQEERYVSLFFKEAFVSTRFTHPNVITVHDARLIEGEYCMFMDFISGQTVSDIAQRGFESGRPLPITHSVQIIADACDGLHYAHRFRDLDDTAYSIIHCDISPQNLMVNYQGVTKVFDFGIAHIPGYESTNSTVAVGGKYAYMSPEQTRGEHIDARSDIFSLGIILYELCTGYRLFRRGSQHEVILAVTEEPIKPPSELRHDIPLFLERTIMRALERNPRDRYPDAAAMRDDLLQLLAMMSKGSERAALGEYVSSLFKGEQMSIADTIRQGYQGMLAQPAPVDSGHLHELGHSEGLHENTMELAAPTELRDAYAKLKAANPPPPIAAAQPPPPSPEPDERVEELMRAAHHHATRADHLDTEVARMHKRQNVLLGAIFVLAIVSLGLAAWGVGIGAA